MKIPQLYTGNCRHEYSFKFKDESHIVGSYVRLTEKGKAHLETHNSVVKLTEHFYMNSYGGRECWKYLTDYVDVPPRPFHMATDCPPEELIEEVIPYTPPAPVDPQKYLKVKACDWEVPDVLLGWIAYIVFFVAVAFFKDWYIKLILRIIVGWYFGLWRQKRMVEEAKWKD